MAEQTETGIKWWMRHVIVPIIGGGGVVAILVALIEHSPPKATTTNSSAVSVPTASSPVSAAPKENSPPVKRGGQTTNQKMPMKRERGPGGEDFYFAGITKQSGWKTDNLVVHNGNSFTLKWDVIGARDQIWLARKCGDSYTTVWPVDEVGGWDDTVDELPCVYSLKDDNRLLRSINIVERRESDTF